MEAASEIIKFQPNIPVRLTLKFDGTKPCKSKFNDEDQYMLTSTDGRIAFLTPYANSRLDAAGAKRGDEISIVQTVLMKGQRKSIDWIVTKVEGDTRERSAATVAAVAAPTVPTKPRELSKPVATSSVASRLLPELEDALKTAIASAKAAEQYGQEVGYVVKFDKDDIRSMAITVLIGKQRGERY
jgi:hypothetical protein